MQRMTEREFVDGLLSFGYDAYIDEEDGVVMAIINPETQSRGKLERDVREKIGWDRSFGSILMLLPDRPAPDGRGDKKKQKGHPDTGKPGQGNKRPPRAPDRDAAYAAKTQRKTEKRCRNAAVTEDDQLPGQMSFDDIFPGFGG